MLMESEQSIAREDKGGSGTAMEFMAMAPVFLWCVCFP
jgi:Flp pilus assembly protein TadG